MAALETKNPVPWIVFEAKDWLDVYLNNKMKVFEWGSGSSTLYFCKKANYVISVEHDGKWFNDVSNELKKSSKKNHEYYLIKPTKAKILKKLPYSRYLYNSKTFEELKGCSFRDYVKKINHYPDNYFDLVVVDGRARASCIRHSIKKIKKGGVLMLDNSERPEYNQEMKRLDKYKRKDFVGRGPFIKESWQTTIWFKGGNGE